MINKLHDNQNNVKMMIIRLIFYYYNYNIISELNKRLSLAKLKQRINVIIYFIKLFLFA